MSVMALCVRLSRRVGTSPGARALSSAPALPLFKYQEMFEHATPDTTPYRKLEVPGIEVQELVSPGGSRHPVLRVPPAALTALTRAAMVDIAHLLRPGHLAQLRSILDDADASANDKTRAVTRLSDTVGLIEWVPGTVHLRAAIEEAGAAKGAPRVMDAVRNMQGAFSASQGALMGDPAARADWFRKRIMPNFPAVFHHWFIMKFGDPSAWFDARLRFTRSCAVWSITGALLGLGDRHGENLLIVESTGECVHVDFDCLFDKATDLTVPEVVPFRLTPQMIDAFGLWGVDGVFRRGCETALRTFRNNTDVIRSILESFLHDPLVEWTKSALAAELTGGGKSGAKEEDVDMSKASTMLKTIVQRLEGQFVWFVKSDVAAMARPWRSAGGVALSVEGQVHRLIKEAAAHENLSALYIGWMPFL